MINQSPSGGVTKERLWLIRLPGGQVETCRELATLQQWIVSGKVDRTSGISRTGKTWKPLGEIAELASFFAIAEEAQRSRVAPRISPAAGAAGAGAAAMMPPSAAPPAPTPPPAVADEPAGAFDEAPAGAFDAGFDTSMTTKPVDIARPRPEPKMAPPQSPVESGKWSGNLHADDQGGPSGPVGGMRGIARVSGADGDTGDVAFGKSRMPIGADRSGEFHGDVFADEEDAPPAPRSSAARWIVLLSLLLMGGAAFVVYFMVFRESGAPTDEALDAGALVASDLDAGDGVLGVDPAPPPSTEHDEILASVDEHLLGDDRAALEKDLEQLGRLSGGDSDAAVLLARARVLTSLAQHELDRAAAIELDGAGSSDAREQSRQLTRQSKQHVLDAFTLVKQVEKLAQNDPGAELLKADIARLQGKSQSEVERQLTSAEKAGASNRDAVLIRALTAVREGKAPEARRLFEELASGAGDLSRGGDVRPLYRLALLDMADRKYDDAKRRADVIATARPGHTGAKDLLARADRATSIDTSDPLPPEESGDDDDDDSSFDSLLDRANRKAENNDCKRAMELFERALDLEPTNVKALTGMGYCHIDRKEFASAHGKFKAALAVSSRYQDALWGIAEAYQQQGLTKQAVAAYRRFLEEHPTSSRAVQAKKQIDKLGGSSTAPTPGGDGADGDGSDDGDSGDSGDSGNSGSAGQGSGGSDKGAGADSSGESGSGSEGDDEGSD